MSSMTSQQYDRLVALAEDEKSAPGLLAKLDENPRLADGLWDITCLALLTVGFGACN